MDVTVKTLDSQNKTFNVPEDMTVRQFKEKIAESINIAADTQRLIFQGRVMQDDKLLKDYDVHGKVIHVVHRMPPRARPPAGGATSEASPQQRPQGRDVNSFVNIVQDAISGMGEMGRNARVTTRASNDGASVDVHIHLGQGTGQVESESQQRINHARNMLRIARENIDRLENRRGSNSEAASPMESSSTSPPQRSEADQDVVMESDEQQTSSQAEETTRQSSETLSSSQSAGPQSSSQSRESSANGEEPGNERSTRTETQNGSPPTQPRLIRPRISALGEVLNEVMEINRRFQPHFDRYQRLLMDDPQMTEDEQRENTRLCNLVGEIIHAISHCYHSLSDLMIDLNQPIPRHLYAAFISPPVQTTLIHQQTIPVHINASPRGSPRLGRRSAGTQSTVSTSSSGTSTPSQSTNATGSQTPTTSTQSTGTSTGPMPGGSIPGIPPQATASGQAFMSGLPGMPEGADEGEPLFHMFDMGTDSVTEISAHVITTEREITIPTGSNPHQSIPSAQGNIPGVPPDLIQNLVSSVVMGHMGEQGGRISRSYAEATRSTPTTAVPSNMTTSETSSSGTQTATGQTNSSETQTAASSTNTSGTQTRPRTAAFMMPGIPGAMPGMRGGVDPYLPCSSRHFLRQQVRNAAGQGIAQSMPNIMAGLFGQLNQQAGAHTTQSGTSASTTTTATTSAPSSRASSTPSSTSSTSTTSASGPAPAFSMSGPFTMPGMPGGSILVGGNLPPGMQVPGGMFGPGVAGNMANMGQMIGNLIGAAVSGVNPTPNPVSSSSTPATSTTSSTTSGNARPAAGPQQGEPMFVQMLRSMLQTGAQQQQSSSSTTSTSTSATSNVRSTTGTSTTSSTRSSTASTSSRPSTSTASNSEAAMTDEVFASLVQGISGVVTRSALGQGPPETISSFLSTLGETHQIVPGEGFVQDVFNVAASNLTFPNLIQVFYGSPQPLDRLRVPLQEFIRTRVLNNEEPSLENIVQGAERLVEEMQEELRESANVSVIKPRIDLVETWNNFFRHQLINIITFIMRSESDSGFGEVLYGRLRRSLSHLIILTRYCLQRGMPGLQALIQNRLEYITRGVNPMIQQWMINVTTQQLNQFLPTISDTDADITMYIALKVEKKSKPKSETSAKPVPMETASPGASQPDTVPQAMDVGSVKPEEAATLPSTSKVVSGKPDVNNSNHKKPATPESPGAAIGGDSWQREVPPDWVPVINGDVEKQKQQRQPPFSDAYLNGMPPKRRKLMTQDRPGNIGNTRSSLTEHLSHAVAAAGVEPISSVENMTNEASSDTELHGAFEEQVSNSISNRLKNDSDFNKDKYPKTEQYYQQNSKK